MTLGELRKSGDLVGALIQIPPGNQWCVVVEDGESGSGAWVVSLVEAGNAVRGEDFITDNTDIILADTATQEELKRSLAWAEIRQDYPEIGG